MSFDVLVLALSTVVRPTSAAAVVAMLASRHPHRLLLAYVVAGLTFSLAVGALVVLLSQQLGQERVQAAGSPVLDVVLGAAAAGYAAAVGFGWLPRRRDRSPHPSSVWIRQRLQDLSPSGAAAAGVLTHLPGLVYLAALNKIVLSTTNPLDDLLQVVVYNAIWFSVAIAALAVAVYRPSLARQWLARLSAWFTRHLRVIIVVFFGGVGVYLLVSGVLGLVDRSGRW